MFKPVFLLWNNKKGYAFAYALLSSEHSRYRSKIDR